MIHDGHQYTIRRSTENQLSVIDSNNEVIGILTIDHNIEHAQVLSFYDDGSEEAHHISYNNVKDLSDEDQARIVIAHSTY